jgi:nitronate monooxygenase
VNILDQLKDNLRIPVIGAPLYTISDPGLVIEQCKAGIVGAFPALNARPRGTLRDWIIQIKDALNSHQQNNPSSYTAPFAINQICHKTNDRLHHDMDVCVEQQVPIIITSLRPPVDVIDAVHGYGGVVLHDVISIRHAEKALEQGVDGLVAVAGGAGGHTGTLNPFALVSEIREIYAGPLALSGAITTGSGILAARALGADFAYMGTRFIASREANASDQYKQMIINHAARDIITTSVFTGIPANFMTPSITGNGFDPGDLTAMESNSLDLADDETKSGCDDKPKAWIDIWSAGHGLGTIHNAPSVEDIEATLDREYRQAKEIL